MSKSDSVPSHAQLSGLLERTCNFLGIQTGSGEGNYEAFKALLKQRIDEAAAVHGWQPEGDKSGWQKKGRLGFEGK